MTFLYSSYLWALLGLLIPIAIHLWSKKEGRTIKVGSIKLLQESQSKKSSSIQLNELILLLLRLLIIAVLVFILAEPQLQSEEEKEHYIYVVEPSLLQNEEVTVEKLIPQTTTAEVRLLQPGLPEYDGEPISENAIPNYWQLLGEVENLAADSVVIFTNAFASGFKGKRPAAPGHINWVLLDPGKPQQTVVQAVSKGEGIELVEVVSDHQSVKINRERVPRESESFRINERGDSISILDRGSRIDLPFLKPDTLEVMLVYAEQFQEEMRYVRSSLQAISLYLDRPLKIEVEREKDLSAIQKNRQVIWLSEAPVPGDIHPVLSYRSDSLTISIIEKGEGSGYYLTERLNLENSIEQHLPEQLMAVLEINKDLEEKIAAHDRRVLPLEELQPLTAGISGTSNTATNRDISKYLWFLLAILLIVERGLAGYRKQ